MKKPSIGKFISIGSILTTLTVLFQSAPLYLPILGLALSPLSSLPIAIAAVINVSLGLTVFFSSIFLMIIFSIEETLILCFTTGLLGFAMGILIYRKGIILSTLLSGLALSLGMIILTYIVKFTAFVEFVSPLSIYTVFLIFISFSIVYSTLWNICFKKFMNYLIKIKIII